MAGRVNWAEWQSLTTIRRRWLAAAFAAFALYGGGVALFSANELHRTWGSMAACGYAVAAVALLASKSRGVDLALIAAFCGALAVPLAWMASTGQQQPEVTVVARSAVTLVHHGSPYLPRSTLARTRNPNDYNPYLPVMAVFGLPRVAFGSGAATDPRVWFGLVFLVVFWLALRTGGARDIIRWTALVAASPLIAFELAVGGTDVPMVACLCLGFALLWRPQPVLAGLALGIASSMKSTAWPALLVAFTLLAVRDGRRPTAQFAATALAVMVACVGPFLLTHPTSLIDNTISFPLGLTHVQSQAASPLIGHLLSTTGHIGHLIAVALLVAAAVAVGVSLVVRPPRTVPAATVRLAIALTALFLLMPSTRFGYFIYPAVLVVWMLVSMAGRVKPGPAELDPAPLVPQGA